MVTCTPICQVCACAKVIMYRGISLVAPQTKCTLFTSTETLSLGMEITTIHLELWKVSRLSPNSRTKSALRVKLVQLLAKLAPLSFAQWIASPLTKRFFLIMKMTMFSLLLDTIVMSLTKKVCQH